LLITPTTITLTGCGQPQNPQCQLKTVNEYYHQYNMAMELIDKGKLRLADQKLVTIFQCNKKFAPAYAALGLLRTHAYVAEIDPNVKKTLWKEVKDFIKKSLKYAKDDSQKFIGHVTAMRDYTLAKPNKDWLEDVEDHFEEATDLKHLNPQELPYYQGKEAAYYFMGVAYYEAGEYKKAEDMLKKVLQMAPYGKWVNKASKLLDKIQRIERVEARYSLGTLGKEIAKEDYITRAQLAALLVDELKLPQLFLNSPYGTKLKLHKLNFVPVDIKNNPYKEEIETVLQLGIRGLKPQYDPKHRAILFKPNEKVDRCELAMVLEDIYAKITNNPAIKTKYMTMNQSQNPFKDIDVTNPCFNALMNAVNLGLLQTDNGYVHPHQPVSGAEALEAIYKLRDLVHQNF
jgi:tetratricopeptide (TPR) repeat protein